MPVRKKIEDLLYVRGMTPYAATMNAIAKDHRITPTELARGLIQAACAFYDEHGWFTFPVTITPTIFQGGPETHTAATDFPLAAESPVPYEVAPSQKKTPVPRRPRTTLPIPPSPGKSA